MTRKPYGLGVCIAVLVTALAVSVQAQPKTPIIEHVSGGLYKFTNKFHSSVFLVTDEGLSPPTPLTPRRPRGSRANLISVLASRSNI